MYAKVWIYSFEETQQLNFPWGLNLNWKTNSTSNSKLQCPYFGTRLQLYNCIVPRLNKGRRKKSVNPLYVTHTFTFVSEVLEALFKFVFTDPLATIKTQNLCCCSCLLLHTRTVLTITYTYFPDTVWTFTYTVWWLKNSLFYLQYVSKMSDAQSEAQLPLQVTLQDAWQAKWKLWTVFTNADAFSDYILALLWLEYNYITALFS